MNGVGVCREPEATWGDVGHEVVEAVIGRPSSQPPQASVDALRGRGCRGRRVFGGRARGEVRVLVCDARSRRGGRGHTRPSAGLRNPCRQLGDFHPGLMAAVLDRAPDVALVRKSGVMSVVLRC